MGPLKIGAVDIYSDHPVTLGSTEVERLGDLARAASERVLSDAIAALDEPLEEPADPRSRRLVHQATGMVIAQLGLRPEEALLVMQGHAFSTGGTVMQVAERVLGGSLVFGNHDSGIEESS